MRPLERLIIAMAVEFLSRVSRPPQQRTQVEASHLAFAFYGLGVTPVFKSQIDAPSELVASIQNVVRLASVDAVSTRIHGAQVWRMRFSRFSLIVALKNDLLTLSVSGSDPTAEWMQHLIEGPETVMDSISSQLSKLKRERGFTGANIGFLDVSAVGEALLSAEASPIKDSWTHFGFPALPQSPICASELKQVFTLLPRIEFGGLLSDDTKLSGRAIVSMAPWLADLLRASFVTAPSHVAPSSSTAELSIGLRLGPALAGLSSLFRVRKPIQCEALKPVEALLVRASASLSALNTRMPSFASRLDGFHVAFWTPEPSKKNTRQKVAVEALAAVRGDGVPGLVAWIKSLSPALNESLESTDGRPRLPPLHSRPTYLSEPVFRPGGRSVSASSAVGRSLMPLND